MSKCARPPLKIGMPVYNGERFIGEALLSLVNQSYTDWELLIADNASTDKTREICESFVATDSRIRYIRHAENIGPGPNFRFLLERTDSKYFMWAACDDLWAPEFIASCMGRLLQDKTLGMAFTGLEVIDSFGQPIRNCSEIPRYSGPANLSTIARYVWSPEVHGKANLIYSIYRTDVCEAAYQRVPFDSVWGGDMCFNLAAMSIAGVDVTPDVYFFKRDPRSGDTLGVPSQIVVPGSLIEQSCPLDIFPVYLNDMLAAVRGTRFYPVVYAIMKAREWRLKNLARQFTN